jgi:hypothetical protein
MQVIETQTYPPYILLKRPSRILSWLLNLMNPLDFLTGIYYRRIKRPIKHYIIKTYKSNRGSMDYGSYERLKSYHMTSFQKSEYTDDPFAFSPSILSPEKKIRICKNRIRALKTKISDYYVFTNGRIKPEDIYELEMLKNEIDRNEKFRDPS